MIVSAYQPYFCPYPAFFYKAHLSDAFVILDEVQFPRGTTWVTRNRFKNHQGPLWMTVPVWKKGLGLQKIDAVRICHEGRWTTKSLASFEMAYGKAPYYREQRDFLEDVFSSRYEQLIDLNMAIIQRLKELLRIRAPFVRLSELSIEASGDRLLTEICKKTGATQFLAQRSARKFLNADVFSAEGIELHFFNPPSPVYPQLWGPFLPNLSAWDLLFNCGPKAHDILIGNR